MVEQPEDLHHQQVQDQRRGREPQGAVPPSRPPPRQSEGGEQHARAGRRRVDLVGGGRLPGQQHERPPQGEDHEQRGRREDGRRRRQGHPRRQPPPRQPGEPPRGNDLRARSRGLVGPGVQPVDHVLLLAERAAVHAESDHQPDEDDGAVDDGRDRLVEVVVVRRDELAHLVDEEPEPDPTDHGGEPGDPGTEEEQGQQLAGQHAEPTPEDVCHVQATRTDLGIVRRCQEGAGHPDAEHRADQEQLDALRAGRRADQDRSPDRRVSTIHPAMLGDGPPADIG
ncbi:hypothetical protein [Micromonospora fulviviridis]|uniref:hypothetical protein n=1 Tax=Micromonospora fulviviridis TaxID=47860 RepID=UPI00166806A1|nr:hypothetical protein [Micromonospora fulviviridis]